MQSVDARLRLARLLAGEVGRQAEARFDLAGHFLRIGALVTVLVIFATTGLSDRYLQTLTVRPTQAEALDAASHLAGDLSFHYRRLAGRRGESADAHTVAQAVSRVRDEGGLRTWPFRVWSAQGVLLYSTLAGEGTASVPGGEVQLQQASALLRPTPLSPPGLAEETSAYWDVKVPLIGLAVEGQGPATWGVLQIFEPLEPGAAMDLQQARLAIGRLITLSLLLFFGALLGVVVQGQDVLLSQTREAEEAHQALARQATQLERVVAERTRDLQEAQARLRTALDHLVDAQEEERRVVSYDIHDSVLQYVIAADMHLKALDDDLPRQALELENYRMALERLKSAISEGRRVISHLRPPSLDDFGLAETLRRYLIRLGHEWGCPVQFREHLPENLNHSLQVVLFRIVQGALLDARRHPIRQVEVTLQQVEGEVQVRVRSWLGAGDVQMEAAAGSGLTMLALQERVRLLGGWYRVQRTGEATEVSAGLPLAG